MYDCHTFAHVHTYVYVCVIMMFKARMLELTSFFRDGGNVYFDIFFVDEFV